jgi:hypothetical protein
MWVPSASRMCPKISQRRQKARDLGNWLSAESVKCEADYLLFQAGDSEVMHDNYLDFCREFKLLDDENKAVFWYEQLHLEFSAPRPDRLGFAGMCRWPVDSESLADFFAIVERSSEFKAGLTFPHWSFHVYHTEV